MSGAELLAIAMVVCVCGALFVGYPVALTLGGGSLLFAFIAQIVGVLDISLLGALPQRVYGVMINDVLAAIPLFVFMGVMLERSRIAEELLDALGRLFGSMAGGLGIATVLVGGLLAAAKGVVGATVVTIAVITLPIMLRAGYDKRIAAGTVAATATLAQIMPPATVLVLLGDQLRIAHQTAQFEMGNFAPVALSISDLFAGAIGPALMLVMAYVLFIAAAALLRPATMPPIADEGAPLRGVALLIRIVSALVAPLALIVAVIGSILAGLATPTEAAAVGAVGALLLAARHVAGLPTRPVDLTLVALLALVLLRTFADPRPWRTDGSMIAFVGATVLSVAAAVGITAAAVRVWRAGLLVPTLTKTLQTATMIFTILIGATMFSLVFRGLGGDAMVHRALSDLPGGVGGAMFAVMVAMFLLGFVMDAFEIIFVVVPIVAPVLLKMEGIDPVWLGVMMAMNLQTSYLHPPLGPTLFFLRAVAPPEITTSQIYVGVLPFVAIQIAMLAALWTTPVLATWLPRLLGG